MAIDFEDYDKRIGRIDDFTNIQVNVEELGVVLFGQNEALTISHAAMDTEFIQGDATEEVRKAFSDMLSSFTPDNADASVVDVGISADDEGNRRIPSNEMIVLAGVDMSLTTMSNAEVKEISVKLIDVENSGLGESGKLGVEEEENDIILSDASAIYVGTAVFLDRAWLDARSKTDGINQKIIDPQKSKEDAGAHSESKKSALTEKTFFEEFKKELKEAADKGVGFVQEIIAGIAVAVEGVIEEIQIETDVEEGVDSATDLLVNDLDAEFILEGAGDEVVSTEVEDVSAENVSISTPVVSVEVITDPVDSLDDSTESDVTSSQDSTGVTDSELSSESSGSDTEDDTSESDSSDGLTPDITPDINTPVDTEETTNTDPVVDQLIEGDAGDNILNNGAGNDTIYGYGGNDTIYAFTGDGNDIIDGGSGTDTLSYENVTGGVGVTVNLRTLTAQNTVVTGTDTISNIENIIGSDFDDHIVGDGAVNDIRGGDGNDRLIAGNSNDTVYGEDGDDDIFGEKGNDTLYGGDGADTIDGGGGNDTSTGGTGADTFVASAGSDVITDFEDGTDKIDVFDRLGLTNIGQLTISASGATDTLITNVGSGLSTTVQGVLPGQFDSSDFIFS